MNALGKFAPEHGIYIPAPEHEPAVHDRSAAQAVTQFHPGCARQLSDSAPVDLRPQPETGNPQAEDKGLNFWDMTVHGHRSAICAPFRWLALLVRGTRSVRPEICFVLAETFPVLDVFELFCCATGRRLHGVVLALQGVRSGMQAVTFL